MKNIPVTLNLPNLPNIFPVFHTSEVRPFTENDNHLFPSRALIPPDAITINGQQEFFIDRIVDECQRGKTTHYRVRWQGEGPEGNIWLPAQELNECEALDIWNAQKITGSSNCNINFVCAGR